ncbi:hypothetical protein [Desulfosporosinus nitroreducens]|uniref:Uncharacterized protein n=1 Tax=Desulfosporosinus nitroreducens TaxID=2018668 RepID=A0ABT8QMM5_9FIRM|nr:hypothetical protein [Desulfosporosinus nitroreducens]MCO1603933.1 hypothetical protein [Desulfosporosinus nitroreducens]MDO0822551.1 hypothetical protein [Desulfosporosinus nitroreducens]
MDLVEWVKIQTLYDSEKQAQKTANIVATTEARLANQQHGPQYEVETRVDQIDGKWQVFWRKVFIGNKTGCGGGCQSCSDSEPIPKKSTCKVIPFRKPSV